MSACHLSVLESIRQRNHMAGASTRVPTMCEFDTLPRHSGTVRRAGAASVQMLAPRSVPTERELTRSSGLGRDPDDIPDA
jgi:hypothetical protein